MINKSNIEIYKTLARINTTAKMEHDKEFYVISPNRTCFGMIGKLDLSDQDTKECVVYGFNKLVGLCDKYISRDEPVEIAIKKNNLEVKSKEQRTKIIYSNEEYKEVPINAILSDIKEIARVQLTHQDVQYYKDMCSIMKYNYITFNKKRDSLTLTLKSDDGINTFVGNETETKLDYKELNQTEDFKCSSYSTLLFGLLTNDDYELTLCVNSQGSYIGKLEALNSNYTFVFYFNK